MTDSIDEIKRLFEVLKYDIRDYINSAIVGSGQIRASTLSDISPILGLIQSFEFRTPGDPRLPTYSGIQVNESGIATYNTGAQTGSIQSDGDVFFGSNIAAAATTGFMIFSQDQTYNGESMGAGDVMIGDNSSGKPNILWDKSAGQLLFRVGTSTNGILASGFVSYGKQIRVASGNQTISDITYTDVSTWSTTYNDGFTVSGSTITVAETGVYQIIFRSAWSPNATGFRDMGMTLNGSPANPTDNGVGSATLYTYLTAIDERTLNAGDAMKMAVYQNSGGNLTMWSAHIVLRRIR